MIGQPGSERGTGMTRTVVITGASGGIGRATAQLLGARGDRVALIARGKTGLDGAVQDINRAGGTALALPADVSSYEQVREAAAKAEETLGPIEVWVNVAFTSVFAPFKRSARSTVGSPRSATWATSTPPWLP